MGSAATVYTDQGRSLGWERPEHVQQVEGKRRGEGKDICLRRAGRSLTGPPTQAGSRRQAAPMSAPKGATVA